ncbi:NAD(P)-dependent dehydrogenase (short-subunit alcohol dehydrogenase family) [Microbacterium resistens]|uniref:NAD(P)-dependent dehydrogenase (Short-subunit alcohol dehydrogenase family) n=1 Tax=Microbacterium resistens TaxID=156977 RepID=A0ABU1S8A3_9MICO|nr:SDR family NAD(P)-dependent oxidoreductase [Microbacterium resistens]MDR6865831.1 NAD(P)-dependent dehydrogenase (short-subunit alcohol dehydrogenase family) [Microbacterium resistens]
MTWSPADIPPLQDRVFVVTGATAGIGYFSSELLARSGAHVVLASRSASKLRTAQGTIRSQAPGASLSAVPFDLTSLTSVADAAEELAAMPRIDGVLLNAGSMDLTRGKQTADGLPTILGTHAVANFALLAGLVPSLMRTAPTAGIVSRIVHTSTGFVNLRAYDVDDVSALPRSGVGEYTKAKTITEVFAFELDRRLRTSGAQVSSLVVRPGVGVDAKTPERTGIRDATTPYQRNYLTPFAQGKDTASWYGVRALTDPDAQGGDYFAPPRPFQGPPVRVRPLERTRAPGAEIAGAVWRQLEELSGTRLDLDASR